MFSKLRTAAVPAFVCLSALLAVPAACLVVFVASGAYEKQFPHRRSIEIGRMACHSSPSLPCMMPLPQ